MVTFYGPETVDTRKCPHGLRHDDYCEHCHYVDLPEPPKTYPDDCRAKIVQLNDREMGPEWDQHGHDVQRIVCDMATEIERLRYKRNEAAAEIERLRAALAKAKLAEELWRAGGLSSNEAMIEISEAIRGSQHD